MIFKIRSRQNDWFGGRDVAIFAEYGNERAIVEPFVIKTISPGDLANQPTLGGNADDGLSFLQACLDHAWEIGLRPAGFSQTTEQVAAIKQHLADMRALVFKGQVKPNGATP